jgi:hypothetical protein
VFFHALTKRGAGLSNVSYEESTMYIWNTERVNPTQLAHWFLKQNTLVLACKAEWPVENKMDGRIGHLFLGNLYVNRFFSTTFLTGILILDF